MSEPTRASDDNGLLAGYDLEHLRDKIERPPFAGVLAGMTERFRHVAEQDAAAETIRPGGWCHSLYFTPMVLEAAFLWRIAGEQGAARHVARGGE